MLVVPNELKTFRDTVSSGMGNLNSSLGTLKGSIEDFCNACTRAQSGIDQYYNSQNKNTVIRKFTSINSISSSITSSLSGYLQTVITKAQELIGKVDKLDGLSKEVESEQEKLDRENKKSEEERDKSVISSSNSIINKDTTEFNALLIEAENMLKELKSMDESLDFVTQFSSNGYLDHLDALEYGTFTYQEYISPTNGTKVEYWIYVPDYGQEVEGLPIHMYLHGSGENYDGVLRVGLPQLIKSQQVTPSGIVICPQGHDNFYEPKYQDALIELLNKTVDDYNADENKISLSGHSKGAVTGYQLIQSHPDYFSAFVPISGNTYLNFEGENVVTKVWGFHGERDTTLACASGAKAVKRVEQGGADTDFYIFDGLGHSKVQTLTFNQKYKYKDGEEYAVLDWCFEQDKEYS